MTTFTIDGFTITSTCPGMAQVRQGQEPSWPIRYFEGEFTREVAERLARNEPYDRRTLAALARDESGSYLGYNME